MNDADGSELLWIIVEPNFANHITKKGMILSDLYNLSKLSFEDGDETVERPVVWANAEDLLSAVADEGAEDSREARAGVDAQHSFLRETGGMRCMRREKEA